MSVKPFTKALLVANSLAWLVCIALGGWWYLYTILYILLLVYVVRRGMREQDEYWNKRWKEAFGEEGPYGRKEASD